MCNLSRCIDGIILQVASDLSIGDHSSTKKFSIGIVPFKHKIDRLTHDKGPDFFRSTLKANLEAQKKLKDERLDNLAKVIDCCFIIFLFFSRYHHFSTGCT
jgi:hypothetical protein